MDTAFSPRLQCGSTLACSLLLGSFALAFPNGNEAPEIDPSALPSLLQGDAPASGSLEEALKGGRFWMNFRYRYEGVDQKGLPRDAHASTLRTRLGYESAEYKNWTGLIEFSDVSTVGGGATDYNDTINGKTDRPVIADPRGSVVNQVYLTHGDMFGGSAKIGRQRIKLDNGRFIGNVGWRQTEQTYDALSWSSSSLAGLSVDYAYIDHINLPFGPRSANSGRDSNSHVLHATRAFDGLGSLSAYGYYLDLPEAKALNTFTYGLRFVGDRELGEWTLLYTAELAHQNDVASNPNDVSAGYMHGVLGGKLGHTALDFGYQVLDGANNAGGQFSTPLATAHAHNGWADKFLATPQDGLEDIYMSLSHKHGATKLAAVYHDFSAEGNSGDYGTELDLLVTHKLDMGLDLGVKYADYDAKNFATNTQKFWVWLSCSF
ncbi:MAG TPA: hypothetical protein EYG30_08915 [Planctomycetes bacterium]|nr:hypothetical protein [Planctomycetota bacterium]HIL52356.1 hypothetical protein [Planctomycetota bacterium]